MIATSLRCFVASLGFLLLQGALFGQAAPASPSELDAPSRVLEGEALITSQMKFADPRLQQPVALSADSISLGELLEALSAQTRVALSMDSRDIFSGVRITCDLKQVPLADVMNALWSLVGCKNGLWEWKIDARQTPMRYSLRPTAAVYKVAAGLRAGMQERFEAQVHAMVQMAFLSPEARKDNIERFAALMDSANPESAKAFLTAHLERKNTWTVMRLFADLLLPDQRTRVLRGEDAVAIPLSALSPEDLRAVRALETSNNADRSGGTQAEPPPVDTIQFEGIRYSNSAFMRTSPSLQIGFGRERQDATMQRYLGVFPSQLAPGIFADWMLPGDLKTLDLETRPITSLIESRPEEIWNRASGQAQNISQLAAAENVSFIAVLPEPFGQERSTLLGKTPAQYFNELWVIPKLMHKWRDGILLLNYSEWFFGDEAQFPVGIVKHLRASLQKQDGLLSLDDVADPVLTLNATQLIRLTTEFPFQGTSITLPEPRASICAFYRRYPKAWSEQGVPLDLKMQIYLQNSKLWPTLWEEKERATAVRIQDVPDRWATDVRHTYTVQLHTTKRDWIDVAKFAVVRIPPPTHP